MNKRRLLKLADLLEADAKNKKDIKFDLRTWGRVRNVEAPNSCGTTACAMGLAVISGEFEKDGLTNYSGPGLITPRHKEEIGIGAAMSLFKLSERQACWLFYDDSYPRGKRKEAVGERFVAKRIRALVSGEQKAPKFISVAE